MHTLLFTDLADSTRVTERLGDTAAALLWAAHDRRARDLLVQFDGREIDRSDGFFMLFEAVLDAASFALAYHAAVAELGLAARVGLHVGEVMLRQNDPADVARGAKPLEVEGLAKPFAARIMSLAQAGQTLVSDAAHARLEPLLPAHWRLRRHGHFRLKGVQAPVELFGLARAEGADPGPPADGEKAYRVVLADGLWRPVRNVPHNLAPERDRFVGRAAELAALSQRLEGGARALTLLGAGGTGKTRLVRRYARVWLGDWPGGVYFCDLSEARSLDGIFFTVALALEVPLAKGDAAAQLGHAIAGRGRCLVILDNFEQVAEHAGETLGRWLDRAAGAVFVTTSRVRLHLPGEVLLPIEPLAVGGDAIELFVVRAQAHQPDFHLDAGPSSTAAAVAEVVRLLDGLPLAIELAAARVRVLSPAQIVERLRDRFQLLAGGRGLAARQATLRAAIDWSWDLLAPWEQAALAQCSVFEGGFTLEAAEQVLDLSAWPQGAPVLDTVQSLVDKCLLRSWEPAQQRRFGIDEPYFGMYLSIHEYAQAKCRAAGPAHELAAMQRHARCFAEYGSEDRLALLRRAGGVQRRHALVLDLDNLVVACRRAAQHGWADAAVATFLTAWEVLDHRGPFALGVELGQAVFALDADDALRARAGASLARALQSIGRTEDAERLLRSALALPAVARLPEHEGRLRGHLGNLLRMTGRPELAMQELGSAMAIQKARGDRGAMRHLLATVGQLHNEQGRGAQALAVYEETLVIARELGDRQTEGDLFNSMGVTHAESGRLEEGRRHFEASLAIARELDDRPLEGFVLTNLGCLHHEQGRLAEAAASLTAALTIHREVGNRHFEGYALGDMGRLALQQRAFDEAESYLEQSLVVTRETGDRRIQGSELRSLADLYLAKGQFDKARTRLDEAENVLRAVGDKLYLGHVLCGRAELEHREGNPEAAARACAEAEALALAAHSEPESELRRRIAAVRAAVG